MTASFGEVSILKFGGSSRCKAGYPDGQAPGQLRPAHVLGLACTFVGSHSVFYKFELVDNFLSGEISCKNLDF